ncbi:hypothetical protein AB395_00005528 (plasmid) [Sinorhizobium fredii CCBAU 45436]|nr:hypothetical protein AB395_00005528 [Sinorhizobium fredii CCBAU 45436]
MAVDAPKNVCGCRGCHGQEAYYSEYQPSEHDRIPSTTLVGTCRPSAAAAIRRNKEPTASATLIGDPFAFCLLA